MLMEVCWNFEKNLLKKFVGSPKDLYRGHSFIVAAFLVLFVDAVKRYTVEPPVKRPRLMSGGCLLEVFTLYRKLSPQEA